MRKITRLLGMIHIIPDEAYLKIAYRLELGKPLNLERPASINEKMQWLKLYGATDRFSALADKWTARDHVRRVLGGEYLVPAFGVYDRSELIPWQSLPDRFVVKCTHGSHCGLVCRDKSTFDREDARRKLDKWLRRNWFWYGREPIYRNIIPRIIVERCVTGADEPPVDYKIMCFHGVPRVVQAHEKTDKGHAIGFYDALGNRLDLTKKGFPQAKTERLDAKLLGALLPLAATLAGSVDLPYLRTDFYYVDGKVYFSEMTFFDSAGFKDFEPEGANEWLGDMLRLDAMLCPQCGGRVVWTPVAVNSRLGFLERVDECPCCGYTLLVQLAS